MNRLVSGLHVAFEASLLGPARPRLYANKPITAGDGGWVHAREKKHHDRLKSLVNHGFEAQTIQIHSSARVKCMLKSSILRHVL